MLLVIEETLSTLGHVCFLVTAVVVLIPLLHQWQVLSDPFRDMTELTAAGLYLAGAVAFLVSLALAANAVYFLVLRAAHPERKRPCCDPCWRRARAGIAWELASVLLLPTSYNLDKGGKEEDSTWEDIVREEEGGGGRVVGKKEKKAAAKTVSSTVSASAGMKPISVGRPPRWSPAPKVSPRLGLGLDEKNQWSCRGMVHVAMEEEATNGGGEGQQHAFPHPATQRPPKE